MMEARSVVWKPPTEVSLEQWAPLILAAALMLLLLNNCSMRQENLIDTTASTVKQLQYASKVSIDNILLTFATMEARSVVQNLRLTFATMEARSVVQNPPQTLPWSSGAVDVAAARTLLMSNHCSMRQRLWLIILLTSATMEARIVMWKPPAEVTLEQWAPSILAAALMLLLLNNCSMRQEVLINNAAYLGHNGGTLCRQNCWEERWEELSALLLQLLDFFWWSVRVEMLVL
jgi:uncharacterized protein YcfL